MICLTCGQDVPAGSVACTNCSTAMRAGTAASSGSAVPLYGSVGHAGRASQVSAGPVVSRFSLTGVANSLRAWAGSLSPRQLAVNNAARRAPGAQKSVGKRPRRLITGEANHLDKQIRIPIRWPICRWLSALMVLLAWTPLLLSLGCMLIPLLFLVMRGNAFWLLAGLFHGRGKDTPWGGTGDSFRVTNENDSNDTVAIKVPGFIHGDINDGDRVTANYRRSLFGQNYLINGTNHDLNEKIRPPRYPWRVALAVMVIWTAAAIAYFRFVIM